MENWTEQRLVVNSGLSTLRFRSMAADYNLLPLAGWPRRRIVLGYFPSPQILKDPKSLYQAPSGASGSDSRHSFNWYKSPLVIFRSASRSNRWSRKAESIGEPWRLFRAPTNHFIATWGVTPGCYSSALSAPGPRIDRAMINVEVISFPPERRDGHCFLEAFPFGSV